MSLPMPRELSSLTELTPALDAARHDERLAWIRSLNGRQQLHLFDLAGDAALPLSVADLHGAEGEVIINYGKNGLMLFNRFEKRTALQSGQLVGYNEPGFPSLIAPIAKRVTGPGHYTFYDSPQGKPEIYIDYRRVPTVRHPAFPPLVDNESGLRQLVFGNMVDVLRRVSDHVFIGNAFKNLPRDDKPPLLVRIASKLGTAPFVLCQAPRP
jgi:hypothetical protein